MSAPIVIPCEGSGCLTVGGVCPMCGQPVRGGYTSNRYRIAPDRERLDVLAMIARGDYDDEAPR